jgi:hypothetical protein
MTEWNMYWKGYGTEQLQPNLRYNTKIFLVEVRKTIKKSVKVVGPWSEI